MNNYKELKVWQSAIKLVIGIYKITEEFPQHEIYGLTSQLRRCAVSIPSNIAEGCGRNTNKDFNHFLTIALGSTCELETQLIIANKLSYFSDKTFKESCDRIYEIQKMINGLKTFNNTKKGNK
jgi:four helix bundle protein